MRVFRLMPSLVAIAGLVVGLVNGCSDDELSPSSPWLVWLRESPPLRSLHERKERAPRRSALSAVTWTSDHWAPQTAAQASWSQPLFDFTHSTHSEVTTLQAASQFAWLSPQVVHFSMKAGQSFVVGVVVFWQVPKSSPDDFTHVWFPAQLLSLAQPVAQRRLSQCWFAEQVCPPHAVSPVRVEELPDEPPDDEPPDDEPPEDDVEPVPGVLLAEHATSEATPEAVRTKTMEADANFIVDPPKGGAR